MIELKPLETLYLISKEKEEVYTKKNKLFTLIYQLWIDNKIKFTNKIENTKINYAGENFATKYEEDFIHLIDEKKFLEIDNFINNLSFENTLAKKGFLKLELTPRKILLLNLKKATFIKTPQYYEKISDLMKRLEEEENVLNIVCPNKIGIIKLNEYYKYLVNCIKEAYIEDNKKRDKQREEFFKSSNEIKK